MSRAYTSSRQWLRFMAALVTVIPAGVRASTIGVLKKFGFASNLGDSRPPMESMLAPLLIDHLQDKQLMTIGPGSTIEVVERSQQRVGSAVLRGTWVQTIKDAIGNLLFRAGEVYEDLPQGLEEKIARQRTRKESSLSSLEQQVPELLHASQRFEPEIEVAIQGTSFELNWLVDFVDASETRAFQIRAASDGRLIGVKETGAHLSEGVGNVYPKGPKRSAISAVPFDDLDGSGQLKSAHAAVTSASTPTAQSPDLDFRFEPTDERFDQVQAFFFAEETLTWFKQHFDAAPQSQLQVRVQVGNHSNTAFYLRNTIRLGSGDDQRYRGLARDPSIVMHEVGHAIVDRYAGLPSEGEGGSLNEAFADYFAASILDNPSMGEASFLAGPYVRTLENHSIAPSDLGKGLYHDSLVFSGALWDIRKALGPGQGELLAFRSLCRLGPGAKFSDFAPAVKLASETVLDPTSRAKVETILRARGLIEQGAIQ